MTQLGVNIDHVATLRQVRGGRHPSPALAAKLVQTAGADQITIHLREDRRHIQDHDLFEIRRIVRVPLNLEMALNHEILRIALRARPQKVCVVPERRQELTTEGGLDAAARKKILQRFIPKLHKRNIEVSLFINPVRKQVKAAWQVRADAVELHTGAYANAKGARKKAELNRLRKAAWYAHQLGLQVNAGHGLDYENVKAVARIPEIEELNIGHSIVSRAVFTGLRQAVGKMKKLIQ